MLELSPPDDSAVVLIGCHTFETLGRLPAVANNLTGLAEALTDPTIWGISEDRLIILDNPQRDVEVLRALRAAESTAKDTFVVYYAGHGLIDPMNGELYLAAGPTSGWSLEVEGEAAPHRVAFGWANAFDLPRGGTASRWGLRM